MKPEAQWVEFETDWPDDETDEIRLSPNRGEQWDMVYRAVIIYLSLAMGLGAIISFSGGNPLAYGWFMPKIVFLIVGLALLVAWANSQLHDQEQNLAGLMGASSRPATRPSHRDP